MYVNVLILFTLLVRAQNVTGRSVKYIGASENATQDVCPIARRISARRINI